jgi:hypothetical protein
MLDLDCEKKDGIIWLLSRVSYKIVFSEEVLRLENNSSLLPIVHTDDSGKIILVIAGEVKEYLFRSRSYFFYIYNATLKTARGNSLSCTAYT